MKKLFHLTFAAATACVLAACSGSAPRSGPAAGVFAPAPPPASGSTCHSPAACYHLVPSPRGSYHYILADQPPPWPPGTPMKTKTWLYTSRSPASWGAAVWVTICKPAHGTARMAQAGPPSPLKPSQTSCCRR